MRLGGVGSVSTYLRLLKGVFINRIFVIISDRDKGLLNAVKSELPNASHAMCCQHIAENIHKKFGREYKAPFWQIARAGSDIAFDIAVQALQRDAPTS